MGTIADYERVMGLVFNGRLQPIIDSVTPLSEGLSALKRLQENDVIGKLILQP
jgi:NADPH:quinone reductase-like Zn-dependent oxidoreductase